MLNKHGFERKKNEFVGNTFKQEWNCEIEMFCFLKNSIKKAKQHDSEYHRSLNIQYLSNCHTFKTAIVFSTF